MRRSLVGFSSFVLVLAAAGCGATKPRVAQAIVAKATQWPKADALFHRDPRWLGSDAAFSVPLQDGRILWLFNDTLVATTPAHVRSQAAFVRNTIAVERGSNPTSASMRFYWGSKGGRPASLFPEQGSHWFWPQHGIRLGRALVVFLARLKRSGNPNSNPGFEHDGWRLAVVRDATVTPARWRIRLVTPPRALGQIGVGGAVNLVGGAVNLVGGYVVSLAIVERGANFPGYLVRWRVRDLMAGRLGKAQWWQRHRGWVDVSASRAAPTAILPNAGPECSLTFDRRLDRWLLVRSEGFGATTIVVSFAPSIEGPWSKPHFVFRPPESRGPDAFVYAAKGHPELTGADLIVTYATNTLSPDPLPTLIRETSLYYPRFVRLTFSRR